MKTWMILLSIIFFSGLALTAIFVSDKFEIETKTEDVKGEQKGICIIKSYEDIELIRGGVNDKIQQDDLLNQCFELVSNPDCICVRPEFAIRSLKIGEYLNDTIFLGQTSGSELCGIKVDWTLEWNITKDTVDFMWCKVL